MPQWAPKAGTIVEFGCYKKTAKGEKDDLEWVILGSGENGVLLITRYVIDCVPYNEARTAVTWETSTLREWMNKSFYMQAFDDSEQSGIAEAVLENADNPVYGTAGGAQTTDRIFALSYSEARKYLTDDTRNTQATAYAAANGAKLRTANKNKWVYWWLRTPGDERARAMITTLKDNDLDYKGNGVGRKFDDGRANNTGVRPALWLSWAYVQEHLNELVR